MKSIKILLTLFLCSVSLGYGQIISYDFRNFFGDEVSVNSNFNDAALTQSTITRGSGLMASTNADRFNAQNWALTSIANADLGNKYMEFTITPNVGYEFDITTIVFNVQRSNNGLSAIALRSSEDGFVANIDGEKALLDNNNLTETITFNVSQPSSNSAISYRVYGYAETTVGRGGFEGNGNDIVVYGSVSSTSPVDCLVSDNFSANTLGTEWTDVVGGNSSIISNQLSIGTGGLIGFDYLFQDVSSAYNTQLSTLGSVITWEFNMQQNRVNPGGFGTNDYGVAFVLGGTESDITEGSGYAVVLGNSNSSDFVRLVSYSDGLDGNSNLTDIIAGGTDYGNEYLSIRVTYNPTTDTWELFVRDDGLFFSSPISLTASDSQGTAVNTTHTDLNLDFIAPVWKHNIDVTNLATFDNICISTSFACPSSVTWDGAAWSSGTPPDLTTAVILTGNYNTAAANQNSGFSACSLTVDSGVTLTVNEDFTIEIENDVTNSGTINIQTDGSFVQNNNGASFTNTVDNDDSFVTKKTAPINNWYEYTYWSSPVVGELIGDTFFGTNADRRFSFNAANFQDSTMENMNDNATVPGQDDIDDDYNDWELVAASDIMSPGVGYAATLSVISFNASGGPSGVGVPGSQFDHIFEGPFNNGVIKTPVVRNDIETSDTNWNFIGNPYPSAIDVDDFFAENVFDSSTNPTGTLDGAIYFWSQNTAPSDTTNGNEALNFDISDYATINGTGQIKGGEGIIPSRHIPSGQGFFVSFSDEYSSTSGNAIFRNSMRVSGNNDQFFRYSSESITSQPNKLWLDLTSDNGVSSQILIGYVDGATNNDDGAYYDAVKNASTGNAAFMYSTIDDGNDKKFAIQGKSTSSLTVDEVVPLGIITSIDIPILYSISIAQLEGGFLTTNTIILKDYLMNTVHDLSNGNYTFTSDSGEFNDRFEILFNPNILSTDAFEAPENSISIIELQNDNVKFSVTNDLTIKSIKIIDVLGRELHNLKGSKGTETYKLSNLNQATYIAQIELSNGATISKKAIKK